VLISGNGPPQNLLIPAMLLPQSSPYYHPFSVMTRVLKNIHLSPGLKVHPPPFFLNIMGCALLRMSHLQTDFFRPTELVAIRLFLFFLAWRKPPSSFLKLPRQPFSYRSQGFKFCKRFPWPVLAITPPISESFLFGSTSLDLIVTQRTF